MNDEFSMYDETLRISMTKWITTNEAIVVFVVSSEANVAKASGVPEWVEFFVHASECFLVEFAVRTIPLYSQFLLQNLIEQQI